MRYMSIDLPHSVEFFESGELFLHTPPVSTWPVDSVARGTAAKAGMALQHEDRYLSPYVLG